jgi:hypothetical protein
MKKIVLMLVMLFSCLSYATTATNGVKTWESREPDDKIYMLKITYSTITDDETVTFRFNGFAVRIVVDVTSVDADGDISVVDESGAKYINLENKLGSGDIDYIIPSADPSSNAYGGVPVAGDHTVTLTNCAGAGVTTIYIYYTK